VDQFAVFSFMKAFRKMRKRRRRGKREAEERLGVI
jgi:hypothetical protein